jgi:hypothetical protein
MNTTQDEETLEMATAEMIFIERKLDREIGYNFWKKYVASAFWSQVSTPINLTITFLTAITTAQANTQDLISQSVYAQLAIISLIITTLNTFFRPHTQYATTTEYLSKWNDLGVQFEKEYYSRKNTVTEVESRVTAYKTLHDNVNNLRKAEGANTVNFLTDLLFYISYRTCIRNYKKWLDMDKKVENEAKTSFTKYQTAKKQLVLRSIIRKTSVPQNTIIVHQDDSDTVSEKSVQLTESMKDTLEV